MVALFNLSTYILILFYLGSSLHPYPEILQYNTMILHRYQMADAGFEVLNPGPLAQKSDACCQCATTYPQVIGMYVHLQNIFKMS